LSDNQNLGDLTPDVHMDADSAGEWGKCPGIYLRHNRGRSIILPRLQILSENQLLM